MSAAAADQVVDVEVDEDKKADYFTTPSWCVRRFLEEWGPARAGTWVEPTAGNGAIIRAVNAVWRGAPIDWRATELREREREALAAIPGLQFRICNFLTVDDEPDEEVAVVLDNPPFSRAFECLMQAHRLYPRAEIAFLLRLAFKASKERHAFMRHHMPDEYSLPDRPSFDGIAGDNSDYAWFRWPADWVRRVGQTRMLNTTTLEERQRDRGHRIVAVNPQREMFG